MEKGKEKKKYNSLPTGDVTTVCITPKARTGGKSAKSIPYINSIRT